MATTGLMIKPLTTIEKDNIMSKTNEMIEAVNANIKKLARWEYVVERIEDLTAKRAEVVYSNPAMVDGFTHTVVFNRREAHYGNEWIMEMDYDSHP